MYKSFFGLRENPFNVNPDPQFLYLTPTIREAMDELTYGIENRKGFILLTGEVGTGKTTLINNLLNWLRHRKTPTAFIFNSHLSVSHLLDFILTDFGVPVDYRLKSNMLLRLNTWLVERFRAGDSPVLIVDEAQGLSLELLEEIRLLLNLETASEKLLQIVLVGQPELEDKLKRPELRQLRQRVTLRCHTAPLTREESHGYIAERLRIGGATGEPIFEPDAMDAVHFCSQGIPRVINLLCEHALINAYVEQYNPVPAQMVEEAARDFLLDDRRTFATRSGFSHPVGGNLTVMQSIFAEELTRPCTAEEASLHQPLVRSGTPAPAILDVEEPACAAESCTGITGPEYRDIADSGEGQNESVAMLASIPLLPELEAKQNQKVLCLDSKEFPAGSAAQLLAEMKRNLAVVSPISPIHLVTARGGSAPLSATPDNQTSASGNGALTLEGVNRIPRVSRQAWIRALVKSLQSRCSQREIAYWRHRLDARWTRVSAAVLRQMTQRNDWVQPVRRWIFEFKRDWNAMVNAIASPEIKNTFLQWLRQPIQSNQWRQTRANQFEGRQDFHQ
jgi:general secretion pathway protein A